MLRVDLLFSSPQLLCFASVTFALEPSSLVVHCAVFKHKIKLWSSRASDRVQHTIKTPVLFCRCLFAIYRCTIQLVNHNYHCSHVARGCSSHSNEHHTLNTHRYKLMILHSDHCKHNYHYRNNNNTFVGFNWQCLIAWRPELSSSALVFLLPSAQSCRSLLLHCTTWHRQITLICRWVFSTRDWLANWAGLSFKNRKSIECTSFPSFGVSFISL